MEDVVGLVDEVLLCLMRGCDGPGNRLTIRSRDREGALLMDLGDLRLVQIRCSGGQGWVSTYVRDDTREDWRRVSGYYGTDLCEYLRRLQSGADPLSVV